MFIADKSCNLQTVEEMVKALSDGQKKTYDLLIKEKKTNDKLKDLTEKQLIKAAETYGDNFEEAMRMCIEYDPDSEDKIAEPFFMNEIRKSEKVDNKDLAEATNQINKESDKKDDK